MHTNKDEKWMQQALALAEHAASQGEVPVGAVVVDEKGQRIGSGWNQPVTRHDPSAHAEIIALREAGNTIQNYRIVPGATLYVTVEPCVMCLGAITHARIARLVFGAFDPKVGSAAGHLSLLDAPYFNHRVVWEGGVLAEHCAALLQNFFSNKR